MTSETIPSGVPTEHDIADLWELLHRGRRDPIPAEVAHAAFQGLAFLVGKGHAELVRRELTEYLMFCEDVPGNLLPDGYELPRFDAEGIPAETGIDLLDHLDDDPVPPEVKAAAVRTCEAAGPENTPQTWAAAWILAGDSVRTELFWGALVELGMTADRPEVAR